MNRDVLNERRSASLTVGRQTLLTGVLSVSGLGVSESNSAQTAETRLRRIGRALMCQGRFCLAVEVLPPFDHLSECGNSMTINRRNRRGNFGSYE
jgi:hypothetical protein